MPGSVFRKLQLKDQKQVVVVNAPQTFEAEIAALQGVTVQRDVKTVKETAFALAFVTQKQELDSLAKALGKKTVGDVVLWFAYPKKTSKKYTSDIDRDSGWQVLGNLGFEPVTMVAIDEDWSAKRYRRAEYIKVMTRDKSWAVSKVGKAKAGRKAEDDC